MLDTQTLVCTVRKIDCFTNSCRIMLEFYDLFLLLGSNNADRINLWLLSRTTVDAQTYICTGG